MREYRAPYFENARASTPNTRNHIIPFAIGYLAQLLVCRAVLLNQNPAAVYLVSLCAGLRRTLQPLHRIGSVICRVWPGIRPIWAFCGHLGEILHYQHSHRLGSANYDLTVEQPSS